MRNLLLVTFITVLLAGCTTFVKLTPQGENVAVLQASEVGNCTQNNPATTTVTVTSKIVVNRENARVAQDLRTLARNRAAVVGGDTIVAANQPRNGEQTFNIYRCRR